MQLKIRKIGNGYGVLFPKQMLDDMNLQEDSTLSVSKVDGVYQLTPFDEEFTAQVEAFLQTEAAHRNTYRELAK
ncbi:AbrB/MazE/SpoVT family DNA-binding domain-containing protein [Terriglobus sp. ADX1]|uniref:AbrB/MazE/SpoVT family DNA-binding domain-containing protein n=1 Tax=Terriglobus sp. ADX1 TaxID=2794063 RepID=UPI002FE69A2E